MMFTPEKMEQIQVLFFEKDLDQVVDTVVRQGILQMTDAAELESWAEPLSRVETGDEANEMRIRRDRIESLKKSLSLSEQSRGIQPVQDRWEKLDLKILEIERSFREETNRQEEIDKELERLKELQNKAGGLSTFGMPIESEDHYSYLAVEIGTVAVDNLQILNQKLASVVHILYPMTQFRRMSTVMVIVLKRDREKLQSALRDAGFQPLEFTEKGQKLSPEIFKELNSKIDDFMLQKQSAENRIQSIAREDGHFLQSVHFKVRWDAVKQKIMQYFRKTERTYLLSGWLPSEGREPFVREIRKVTQNRSVVEETPAEEVLSVRSGKVQVPVQLKNPFFLKPFELLTSTYGLPSYLTIDPTPLLGISFLLMFGLMFGDVGHGLVLALLGVFMAFRGKKRMLKHAGVLILYCGCASIVYGFLFGSIFGVEHLLPTLWVKPMESISELFTTVIYFGIGMITLSMAINIINVIRKRNFLGLIFDKAGLLAAILYWSGIVLVTRMLTTQAEAKGGVPVFIMILMLSSVVLLFLREPILHLAEGKRKLFPEGMMTGIMGGIVEILEIFLGFLANTVSFIRVAAFGLAHAGLFMAIFSLSDLVRGLAGGLVSGAVLVFGNVLIICLEGLVVTIQAIRLEFYEFFSRFFEQSSSIYQPIGAELKNPE
jgi:V/A-type H+-transporting ATPase subunit I